MTVSQADGTTCTDNAGFIAVVSKTAHQRRPAAVSKGQRKEKLALENIACDSVASNGGEIDYILIENRYNGGGGDNPPDGDNPPPSGDNPPPSASAKAACTFIDSCESHGRIRLCAGRRCAASRHV